MASWSENLGDAAFQSDDCLFPGLDCGSPFVAEHDEFRSAVGRVRLASEVTEFFQFVDELAHRLGGDVGALRQFSESRTLGIDLGEHCRVFGFLRKAGSDHAFDDLEAEEAVDLSQHGNRVELGRPGTVEICGHGAILSSKVT